MGNCIVKNGERNNNEERYLGVNNYYDTMTSRKRHNKNNTDIILTKNTNIELRDPFSYYDKADRTEHDNEASMSSSHSVAAAVLDRTMPMSPDTLLSLSPSQPTKQQQQNSVASAAVTTSSILQIATPQHHQQTSDQSQQLVPFVSPGSQQNTTNEELEDDDDLVSPLSSDVLGVSRALVPASSSPSRKGRALQARLQKARCMQMALAADAASSNGISLHHLNRSNQTQPHYRNTSSSFDYPIPERTNSSRSIASTITDSCATASIMSGFEEYSTAATTTAVADANVITPSWVDIELGDNNNENHDNAAVVCTAMSRTPMISIVEQTPPLYIAIGTESGMVLVQEILPQQNNGPTGNIITTTNTITSDDNNNALNENNNIGYTNLAALTNNRTKKPYLDDNIKGSNNSDISEVGKEKKLGVAIKVQHQGRVRCVDFSSDGQYLAVGGDDCKCHIYQLVYEMDDNEVLQFTSLHWVLELERVDRVYTVQFSPDSKYFAVGGFDGTVAVYNADDIPNETIAMEAIVEIIRDALVMTLDWSPDSRYLAIGGSDRSCAIIDCQQSWNVFREIRRSSTIQAVRWYPGTGKYLAIACSDTVAIISGKDSFLQTNEINLRKSTGNTRNRRDHQTKYKDHSICWSPNGSFLIVSGPECALYETKKFTLVHKIPRLCNVTSVSWGHHSGIPSDGILPRRFLAIGGDDGKVSILKGGLEANMSGETSSVGGDDMSSMADSSNVSALGDWILKENIFQDADDIIDINVDANQTQKQLSTTTNPMVLVVAFARGSKSRPSLTFAHTTDDGLVTIRNCIDWKILAEIQFPKPVETMSYSFGSRYLALGCADSNVYISDTASNWELVAKIEFSTPISSVQFECKNNERLVVGCIDGTLAFLDPRKGYDFVGEIVASVGAPITTIDWSTKNLAVGRNDGTVLIYDSYEVLKEVYTPIVELERSSSVCALSFGVNSRFLAIGDASGLIGIYSSKGGWVLCHQIDMDCGISSIQWCPLGRHLAFVADNGAMNVIDTIFWAEVREIESASPPLDHGNVVRSSLSFSQDGKLLAFCRSDIGFGILDSTTKWSFALNMLIEPLTEIESEPETEASGSRATASSMEGLTADAEGFYEV